MTAGRESFEKSDRNCREKASDKQICRSHEDQASFPHAAEIDESDEHQNSEAQRKRMRLQAGHCGNKSADASGNAHRNHQNIIDHQSSGSQESRRNTQILPRDGVRSAATGISLDRLTVGKNKRL